MSTQTKTPPPGFFYDPNGDLTRHKPVKAVWIETVSYFWFWKPDTFSVHLDYEDGKSWRWEDYETYKEATVFRDELLKCLQQTP